MRYNRSIIRSWLRNSSFWFSIIECKRVLVFSCSFMIRSKKWSFWRSILTILLHDDSSLPFWYECWLDVCGSIFFSFVWNWLFLLFIRCFTSYNNTTHTIWFRFWQFLFFFFLNTLGIFQSNEMKIIIKKRRTTISANFPIDLFWTMDKDWMQSDSQTICIQQLLDVFITTVNWPDSQQRLIIWNWWNYPHRDLVVDAKKCWSAWNQFSMKFAQPSGAYAIYFLIILSFSLPLSLTLAFAS